MKINLPLYFSILFLGLRIQAETLTITTNELPSSSLTLFDLYCSPITFTETGFKCYIKHRFNQPSYHEFLTLSWSDLLQFLHYGLQQKTRDYPQRIFKLFHKKLKSSHYVNAFAFQELMAELPRLLKHYFEPPIPITKRLHHDLHKLLYSSFLKDFDTFKQQPDKFLHDLATSMTNQAIADIFATDEISTQELRHTLIRFLEQALGKLIWSPEEKDAIWENVKIIAYNIQELTQIYALENEEELDELYWSLLTRFHYFIEMSGEDLDPLFFKKINDDIQHNEVPFINIEEQEDYVESKKEFLMRSIKMGSLKAHAHALGF